MSGICRKVEFSLELKGRNLGGFCGNYSLPFHVVLKEAVFSCPWKKWSCSVSG